MPVSVSLTVLLVSGMSVVFTYLWHVTFFGGCMAVFGYMEEQGRHGVTFRPVLPVSQSGQWRGDTASPSGPCCPT